uniref:VWFC domain-containing protein n=1 Tax=Rhodnius prolixus TaxID=13249 RepID=T1I3X9_RHOPR
MHKALNCMPKGCEYGGIFYKEGDRVKTQDPCLECICDNRHIQCRLKMCPMLPEPPPPSCHILQRPNTCCPRLLCQDG